MSHEGINKQERIKSLCKLVSKLTNHQIDYVETVVNQLCKPYIDIFINENSDFLSECVYQNLGDSIRIHHCFSRGPFTKDKFEYAMDAVLNYCGIPSVLAPSGNPGFDIIFLDQKVSLKTEAESKINKNKIHISKMMELGKVTWDIDKLLEQFFINITKFDRILTLRCLSKESSALHYELLEIPKSLFIEAKSGSIRNMLSSKQNPKPAYCDVFSEDGGLKYQLYFDAGGERKLQIKNLEISYCQLHAMWKFSTNQI